MQCFVLWEEKLLRFRNQVFEKLSKCLRCTRLLPMVMSAVNSFSGKRHTTKLSEVGQLDPKTQFP